MDKVFYIIGEENEEKCDPSDLEFRDLQRLRTRVRNYMADLKRMPAGVEPSRLKPVAEVEKRLTNMMSKSLSGEERDALKALDKAYSQYKVAEEAVYRGAPTAGATPSPSQLRQAVRTAATKRGKRTAYIQGRAGGKMRQVAEDIGETFTQVTPNTGAGLALPAAMTTIGAATGLATESPMLGAVVGGAVAPTLALASAATPWGRRMLRATAAKQARDRGLGTSALQAGAINAITSTYHED